MRTRPAALCCLLFLLVLTAPAAAAKPGSGHLDFDVSPVLDGKLSGSGTGEIHALGEDVALSGDGARVDVLRVWYETEVLAHPVGPVRTDTGPVQTEWRNFTDASFRLDRLYDDFETLVYTDDRGLVRFASEVRDHALQAFAMPWLVSDDQGVGPEQHEGETRVFTYAADGDRFTTPSGALAAEGAFAVYLADARFHVRPAEGDIVSFRSGDSRSDETPASYKEVHSYHIVFVDAGAVAVTGDQAVGWLAAPTFVFDGTLSATHATGTMTMGADHYELDAVPVKVGGAIELRPEPAGDLETYTSQSSAHIGTATRSDGRYSGTSSDVSGDVTVLAIGNEIPYMAEEGLAVAATVGVLTLAGAVLLLSPKGKWLVLGLLAPLYAKTERDRLLDNESRDRIFQAIRTNPGINLSQIQRIADLGWGVTVYHLKMMERNGLVFSEASARDKCFFENDPRFRDLRAAIVALANREPAQRVAQAIAAHPGATQREVVEASGLTQRAVSYNVGRLQKEGLVEVHREGNRVHYAPTEPMLEVLRLVVGGTESMHVPAAPAVASGVEA